MKYHKKETGKTRLLGIHDQHKSFQEEEASMRPTLRQRVPCVVKKDSEIKRLRGQLNEIRRLVQSIDEAMPDSGCDGALADNLNFYKPLSEELCEASQQFKEKLRMLEEGGMTTIGR